MTGPAEAFETVKQVLRDLNRPGRLDEHPWTRALFVREALSKEGALAEQPPGQRLLVALAGLIPLMRPAAPPRDGVRLDSRWGEFGLLAALYYAPLLHGRPVPTSLRDAWARIDASIQLCLSASPPGDMPGVDPGSFRLVADEPEVAPVSTISDWHRKGLERLTDIVLTRERFLASSGMGASPILEPELQAERSEDPGSEQNEAASGTRRRQLWRVIPLALGAVILLALLLLGLKARRIVQAVSLLEGDLSGFQEIMSGSPDLARIASLGPDLERLKTHVDSLRAEAEPFLWLAPSLGWVPEYGCDLAAAPALLDLAGNLADASLLAYQAAQPLLEGAADSEVSLDSAVLNEQLVLAQPRYQAARDSLEGVYAARAEIDSACLSPRLRAPLETQLDPLLPILDDGLSLAVSIPGLLGADEQGTKTYLVLIQNSDELRATGGFITAVGSFVLNKGELLSYQFESSDRFEDWSKPYPQAPWQLSRYMDIPVLVLRDANWFSDYPTTAIWAEYLYAYTGNHSVDGVIAIDQQALIYLLEALGPVSVPGESAPVSHDNLVAYMRSAKQRPPGVEIWEWAPNRKDFIGNLASAILDKLFSDRAVSWDDIGRAMLRALEERHILLQVDDPTVTALLARHAWDGALRPGNGDFLMVVDTNMGYNKTNAVVGQKILYDLDLADPARPAGSLVVFHENQAQGVESCQIRERNLSPEDQWLLYNIDRCYWDYLRVYLPAGTSLVRATPHEVPGEWTINAEAVAAQVDPLEEEIEGVTGFGTLLVVPGGGSLATSFDFALPPRVVSAQPGSNLRSYSLTVQKQPGTLAVPITVLVRLPDGAQLVSATPAARLENGALQFQADLRTDLHIEIVFALP